MKRFFLLILIPTLFLVGCKKDAVDASSTKAFQESINDMSSSLPTIKQIKFNEALYILKTFGVNADGDIAELKALGKLLEGKKVPEIFAMADQVAKENNVNWSSNSPPSLGDMNIFQNISPSETDPNDIAANAIELNIKESAIDSVIGAKAILIVPKLLDHSGKKIDFSNAALETILEVSSQGEKILTAKNLMQNNNFKGFVIRFSSLPKEKIVDDKIDIKISVKTSKKTLQLSRIGVSVNPNALMISEEDSDILSDENNPENTNSEGPDGTKISGDPKNTVINFLNNLNSQNFKAAYSQSENNAWGNYETFANPTSGFGNVKSINLNNVTTKSNNNNTASVNAIYTVTDKSGNVTDLDITYTLKASENGWKINGSKINSTQKK